MQSARGIFGGGLRLALCPFVLFVPATRMLPTLLLVPHALWLSTVALQDFVKSLAVKDVIDDLATLPMACLLTAAADDTSVEAFLKVAPLFLHDTLREVDTPQYLTLTLACIMASNTLNAVRSPPSKDTVLPLCGQPWGPNYYLGDPKRMKWGKNFTLMSQKEGASKQQGDRGWVSSTQVNAVSCSHSLRHLHPAALRTTPALLSRLALCSGRRWHCFRRLHSCHHLHRCLQHYREQWSWFNS